MKYTEIAQQFRNRPYFESSEVHALFEEPRPQVQKSLSVWVRKEKLIQLRRGHYLLPDEVRTRDPSEYYVSNYLYGPSYVSLLTALSYYNMIPGAVGQIQGVTPRHGNTWETELNTFTYRKLKTERFWGYTVRSTDHPDVSPEQSRFYIARLEKALLDLFYLQSGPWTAERIRQMRFQQTDQVDPEQVRQDAELFDSPKVRQAVERFLQVHIEEEQT